MGTLSYRRTRKLKLLLQDILKILSLYDQDKCYFCKKPLVTADIFKMTIHHINGDHEDNSPENLALSHERCHRSFHAKKTFEEYYNDS